MRALLAGFLFAVLPAGAQWKLPDNLAPLEPGAKACNDAGTHCVVNAPDLMARDAAIFFADAMLAAKDREIEQLQDALHSAREDLEIERLAHRAAAQELTVHRGPAGLPPRDNADVPGELFPFRYFDELRKRWVIARYKATREVIAATYDEWEIIGPGWTPNDVEGRDNKPTE